MAFPYTTPQHQLAHAALSHLPDWPVTLEAAMQQPMPASIIRMTAMAMSNHAWHRGIVTQQPVVQAPCPPDWPLQSSVPHRPAARARHQPHDWKMAQAGDTN
jgi:hypothetical protein